MGNGLLKGVICGDDREHDANWSSRNPPNPSTQTLVLPVKSLSDHCRETYKIHKRWPWQYLSLQHALLKGEGVSCSLLVPNIQHWVWPRVKPRDKTNRMNERTRTLTDCLAGEVYREHRAQRSSPLPLQG